jgi:hypothetical protein
LKQRNSANNAWITIGQLDTANLGLIPAGGASIVNADVNASAGIVASKLSFTQAGGGTARTVDSRLKDSVSVKDFGAIGDGTTNDTAAIQAALNAHATILFPPGTYLVNASLSIPNRDAVITGSGSQTTILKFTGGTNGLSWTSTSNANTLSIEGLTLLAAAAMTGTAVSASTVQLGPVVADVTLEDVWATRDTSGHWTNGFYFNNCRNIFVQQCNFTGLYGTSVCGFKTDGLSLDARFYGCQVNDCGIGFKSDGTSEGMMLSHCLSIKTDSGVEKIHATGLEPLISIIGCHFNSRVTCVDLFNCQQSQIVGNLFYAFTETSMPGWTGVRLSGANSNYNVISSNTFHGLGYTGSRTAVYADNGLQNIITSNTIVGADTGVYIGGSASYCLSAMNVFAGVVTSNSISGTGNNFVNVIDDIFESNGNSASVLRLTDRSGPTNSKIVDLSQDNGVLALLARNDNGSTKQNYGQFAPSTVSLGGNLNEESLRTNVGTFANRVEVVGRATGLGPEINAAGSDTNINLVFRPKGTGAFFADSQVLPVNDNSVSLGNSTNRWSTVFAATGTINTSDARQKQDIAELDESEMRVARALKGLIRRFRFKSAVSDKGDAARTHFGIIAQDVIEAFASEGLDATHYGLLCYDEWEELPEVADEQGNILQEYRSAGNRYGIRYEELLSFVLAAI